ncbi:hypothetical protein [Acinetobacter sp. MD2(2019)]|uniref:hypothetical protein n=1 Tax=Acinetobacter sp. MD2(2019) TaxID=2605273 RepID=UPI002D1E7378|nr:hypothetical protein [Acinetobacter sp. MD2(2019)]MEB3754804.1 hypothetical protein [Acinetobacter sp. MD2(2019)]
MRSKKVTLALVPLLLVACSRQDRLVQDVYNNQYDCQNDWNNELCETESSSSSGGHASSRPHFVGPYYYLNNREVQFQGSTLRPKQNLSLRQSIISATAKSHTSSSPIRGGFGRSGFSFGG